jgi:serine/threonine protein kinase
MDFYKVMEKLNCRLIFVKAGGYGSVFKGITIDENGNEKYFALKMVAYEKSPKGKHPVKPTGNDEEDEKNDGYGSIFNISRPENAEIHMLKVLSYFVIKKLTPHIILPILTFNCHIKPFLTLHEGDDENVVVPLMEPVKDENGIVKDKKGNVVMQPSKYSEFLDDYAKGKFYKKASILITEWCDRCDLGMFLRERHAKINLLQWKSIFFQIIFTLAIIQEKYPEFKHNDLKLNNILIQKNNHAHHCTYRIGDMFFNVPSIGYTIYLWDFDFACIPNLVDNQKVYRAEEQPTFCISSKQNRYYDIHYFFCSMIFKRFLPNVETGASPQEVKDFIRYVLPPSMRPIYKKIEETVQIKNSVPPQTKKVLKTVVAPESRVSDRCRLIYDDEYLLPINILRHPFFNDFRGTLANNNMQSTTTTTTINR